MEEGEERISELEDGILPNLNSRKKRHQKQTSKQTTASTRHTELQGSNICVTGVPGGEEKEEKTSKEL